jgi:Gas vesicle synthesis protein GvpL/GvpF
VPPQHLYAVIRPKGGSTRLPLGLDGERLRLMNVGFGTIVYAESPRDVEATLDHLRAYDDVMRELWSRSAAILPARFGTVADSAEQLRDEITGRKEALNAALDLVSGCAQMTIRLPLVATPRPRHSAQTAGGLPRTPGARYLRSKATQAAPQRSVILRSVPGLSDLVKAERTDTTAGRTTIYHLIEAGSSTRYQAFVSGLGILHSGVRTTGPFPPYAFVPGIDPAAWIHHGKQKTKKPTARSARPRADRRGARNARR